MKPTIKFCGEQILRLDGLVGFASMGKDGYRERAKALLDASPSQDIAEAAIDALLGDTARASNAETNRLPSAGEIKLWVEVVMESRRAAAPGNERARTKCDRILQKYEDPEGGPARCQNGWIRHRVWRKVKGMVAEDGSDIMQPYDFSGRCRECQEGGWV